jgi:hypothetical protein
VLAYQLSEQLGITSEAMVAACRTRGLPHIQNTNQEISDSDAGTIRGWFSAHASAIPAFPVHAQNAPTAAAPNWVKVFGAVDLGVTLLFFMILVVTAIAGHEVPPGSRFLVVIVLALGLSIGSAFLGGAAAVEGRVPIPFAKNHPLAVSLTGGIAVFVIVLLIGYYTFIKGDGTAYKPVAEVSSATTTGWESMKIGLESDLEADKNREGEIMTLIRVLDAMSAAAKETQGETESRVYAYASKPFVKDVVQFSSRAELGTGLVYQCIQANAYICYPGSAEVIHHEVSQNNVLVVSVPAARAGSRLVIFIRLCGAKDRLPAPETIHLIVDE